MGKRSSNDSAIMLIVYLIGFAFIMIGYAIKFLENVNKYKKWSNFWLTFPFLCLGNYLAYLNWNSQAEWALILLTASWLSFIMYWSSVLEKEINIEKMEIQTQRDEIISQLAVSTPNCPYCGCALKKMPMRKTRCPHCENFIFVRTCPTTNKTFLVKQENIKELEAQWKNKKNNKLLPVINVSQEMDIVLKYLTANYEKFCNYPQILEINSEYRLKIMQYMWKHWDIRISNKKMREEFPNYDIELLNEIECIEENRRYTYFKMEEFKERNKGKEPLIKTGWMPYEYGTALGICTIDSMVNVYEWYLNKYNCEESFPNYLEMPYEYFLADIPEYKIYLFKNDDFQQVTLKELKEFCKENNYGYPYNK